MRASWSENASAPHEHARTYVRTDGRTTRKLNASGPAYWMGGGIKRRTSWVGAYLYGRFRHATWLKNNVRWSKRQSVGAVYDHRQITWWSPAVTVAANVPESLHSLRPNPYMTIAHQKTPLAPIALGLIINLARALCRRGLAAPRDVYVNYNARHLALQRRFVCSFSALLLAMPRSINEWLIAYLDTSWRCGSSCLLLLLFLGNAQFCWT